MQIASHGKSDRGRVRPENEDAFLAENAAGVFAVADGLGGLSAGREASRLAVDALGRYSRDGKLPDAAALIDLFEESHAEVQGLSRQQPFGSGTTFTVALVDAQSGRARFGHIGDSAAYLLREGELKKLTVDHTQAEELRRTQPNRPVPEAAEHTLTRCLGQPGSIKPDFFDTELRAGDRLILCTDGVTRPATPAELGEWLAAAASPKDFINRVIETVLERGAPDNATVITVFVS